MQIEHPLIDPHEAGFRLRVDREGRPQRALRRGEHAQEAVIVLLLDRIELVIVASSARHRQPEDPAAHGVQTLVPIVQLNRADHVDREPDVLVILRPERDDPQRTHVGPGRAGHEIGRELQFHEAIVRNILVQALDDPVAVPPRVRIGRIGDVPGIVFRIAHDIQPVARPALAVLR